MTSLWPSPVFAVGLTCCVYYLAQAVYLRRPIFILNPVLISVTVIILILKTLGVDYGTYDQGGRIISFFLGPAVVALGLPLYRQLEEIRRQGRTILVSILAGTVVGVVTAAGLARMLGCSRDVAASLAPKSSTTPIAMGIAEKIGGLAPLTAVLVIATGILVAVVGPYFLRLIRVRSAAAFGLAMGAAGHGIGTARALEEGPLEGAAASLAIGLQGLFTALLTPILMWLLL